MPATVISVAEKQSMFGSSKILRIWLPCPPSPGGLWDKGRLQLHHRAREGGLRQRAGHERLLTWFLHGIWTLLKTAGKDRVLFSCFLTLVAVISRWSSRRHQG